MSGNKTRHQSNFLFYFSGRQPGPPPSYPPPPVPAAFQLRQDSSSGFHKGPAPPTPQQHRNPNSALPRKPPPSFPPPSILKDPGKGPPPPIPFAPHLHKSSTPPLPPPPNAKRTLQSRATSVGVLGNDRRIQPAVSIHSPATLPICDQLESMMVLNGPAHSALNTGGTQSLGNNQGVMGNHRIKLSLPPSHPVNIGGPPHRPVVSNTLSLVQTLSTQLPLPGHPPQSLLRAGLHNKPAMPKPPPPSAKPPMPAAKPKPGAPLQ